MVWMPLVSTSWETWSSWSESGSKNGGEGGGIKEGAKVQEEHHECKKGRGGGVVCVSMSHSPQTVGVIVRLEKEAFKVLTQHGKEVNAKPHALQLRKSKGVALDSRQVRTMVATE